MQEPIDGDLAARVFGLLQICDTGVHGQRTGEHSRQRLDIALIGFFQSFRKVYVGEQVMTCSKVSIAHTTQSDILNKTSTQNMTSGLVHANSDTRLLICDAGMSYVPA